MYGFQVFNYVLITTRFMTKKQTPYSGVFVIYNAIYSVL